MKVPKYVLNAIDKAQHATLEHRKYSIIVIDWMLKQNINVESQDVNFLTEDDIADLLDYGFMSKEEFLKIMEDERFQKK